MKQKFSVPPVNNIEDWACSPHIAREIETFAKWSLENPQDFWQALFDWSQEFSDLKLGSSLFTSYDFYHDCIVQHLGKKRVAFRYYENRSFKEWSFDHLHRLVNYQVHRWQNHSFDPALSAIIVMPLGINFLVALLMCVRLGLKMTILPTDSPLLTRDRIQFYIKQLKNSVVITTPDLAGLIEKKEGYWLIEYLEEKEDYKGAVNPRYPSDKVVQMALSCHSQEEGIMEPVVAQDLYLGALRDGFLTLGLKPGVLWAYSPQCSVREQPWLLLTGLLHGATTLIFSEKELLSQPTALDDLPIQVLSVSSGLRDLWTHQKGLPKAKLKLWYHHVFDDNSKKWDEFNEKNKLQKVARARLLIDNTKGGLPFTSIPLADNSYDPLWPALGVPWQLFQLTHQDLPAVHPHGIYKQHLSHSKTSNFILAQLRTGWELAGVVSPQKNGYTIPIKSIEKAASAHNFVEHAVFLDLPTVQSLWSRRYVLLIFINLFLRENWEKEEREWKNIIYGEIKKMVGELFLPDQIDFFPFSPKLEKDGVDRKWASFHYTNGLLTRKKELKAYHLIGLLKKCVS